MKQIPYDEYKQLIRKLQKCYEVMARNCMHKYQDGYVRGCGYPGSEVAHCNKEGREKCPLLLLVRE